MSSWVTKYAKDNGLRKIDARGPLNIIVDATDIKRSKKKDPSCCAFANAAKRQLGGVVAAYFFRSTAWLEYADKIVRYRLPPSMEKEIVAFDRNSGMEPGTYQLSAVEPSMRMSTRKKRTPEQKASGYTTKPKTSKRYPRHRTTNIRDSWVPTV